MSPATRYERLTALRSDDSFDVVTCEAAIHSQFEADPLVQIETENANKFFVRRHFTEGQDRLIAYCVFADEMSALSREGSIGHCKLCRPVNGIVTIVDAKVDEGYRKKGIATAVYDRIATDMARGGALLWPVAPEKMTDPEFKVWWRRSPALVFYYPHRERLGFEPRREFEALLNEELAQTGARGSMSQTLRRKLADVRQWFSSKFSLTRDN
jgi:GNAT superfamily N-acetyltransferase